MLTGKKPLTPALSRSERERGNSFLGTGNPGWLGAPPSSDFGAASRNPGLLSVIPLGYLNGALISKRVRTKWDSKVRLLQMDNELITGDVFSTGEVGDFGGEGHGQGDRGVDGCGLGRTRK